MEQTYTVMNPSGIHARPANLIMDAALQFTSAVTVRTATKTANAKSIVSLLKLGARMGDQVTVSAEGDNAEQVIRAIGEIIGSNVE